MSAGTSERVHFLRFFIRDKMMVSMYKVNFNDEHLIITCNAHLKKCHGQEYHITQVSK